MPTVIETVPDFFMHLQLDRCVTPGTLKTNQLALRHFTRIYGKKDTKDLNPTHIHRFHEQLKEKFREHKDYLGNQVKLSETFIHKTMIRIKTYIRRLADRGLLSDLKVSDIPINKLTRKLPDYLTKQEIKQIMESLEYLIIETEKKKDNGHKPMYVVAAYMRRALVRMLYSTGLRNAELRSLKVQDVDFNKMTGTVLGKGKQYGIFTFNVQAKEKMLAYLAKRKQFYPGKQYDYLFVPGNEDKGKGLTEQGLNSILRKIGDRTDIKKRLHCHMFRHSVGTHLIADGVSIVQVRDKLRHKSIMVTSIYTHTDTSEQLDITKYLVV